MTTPPESLVMTIFFGVLEVSDYYTRTFSDNDSSELDCLTSSRHGKGIMSAALATLMQDWIIPHMGARAMRVETFEGNIGSVRVFEKNGFRLEETVHRRKVTNSGAVVTGFHVLWWRAS